MWARRILEAHESPWTSAVAAVRACSSAADREEIEQHIRPDDEPMSGTGSGYVVDCLRSAVMVQREPSYEAVVRAAIMLGRDTDTTACVAGGIAGLRFGLDAIPIRWLAQLRGGELLDEPVDALAPEPNRAAGGYRRLRLQFARWFGKY